MKRILIFLACAVFIGLCLCSCTKNLSSDLYWNGAEKETKWVEKNVPNAIRSSQKPESMSDAEKYSMPTEPV